MSNNNALKQVLMRSPLFQDISSVADQIALKNWYVAGGCVTQTVWNSKLGLDPMHGLKDVDLIYFDADESEREQTENQTRIGKILSRLGIPVDVKNEALVHTWYAKKFGYEISPYQTTEDGIRAWLPAFAVGVRPSPDHFVVFAPYGLEDLFKMVIRPNKLQITEEIYVGMIQKFKDRWPAIEVIEWS